MRGSSLAAAMVGVLLCVAASDALAGPCGPQQPSLSVEWANDGTGYVPVGDAVVMVATYSYCKATHAVPPDTLRVSVARSAAGPFEPARIEQRGGLFAWRPQGAGLWFLRVDRQVERPPPPVTGAAVVVAYEPKARVRVRLILSPEGGLGKLQHRVALLPALEGEKIARRPEGCCDYWLFPYLWLSGPRPSRVSSLRLPSGRYRISEASTGMAKIYDEYPGHHALRYRGFGLLDGLRGVFDVVSDGDVTVEMHPERRPLGSLARP